MDVQIPTLPTDYLSDGLFDNARYLDADGYCWYGYGMHIRGFDYDEGATMQAALDYRRELREQGLPVKVIKEDGRNDLNPTSLRFRVWYPLNYK